MERFSTHTCQVSGLLCVPHQSPGSSHHSVDGHKQSIFQMFYILVPMKELPYFYVVHQEPEGTGFLLWVGKPEIVNFGPFHLINFVQQTWLLEIQIPGF